jgi:Ribbon-helix-helix protein, copG family
MTMARKTAYGTTPSGLPITDELIEKLSKEAEAGYDVDEMLRRRRGRPPIGSGPATVESVRLDPELRQALAARAESDEETTSAVIREALRQYLEAG